MNKQRRHFTDHDKVAILKRHLIDKVPVSDLCDELDLHPNQDEARERRKQLRQAQHDRRQCQPNVAHRPAIDFAAVRAAVSLAAVLQLLGFHPHTTHGAQQRGPCPLHGSTHGTARCFSANLEQHTFHCFKCGRHGNALDLWAQATRQTPYDAALDLCQRLNIPLPLLPPPPSANREEEPVATGSSTCTIP